MTSSPIGAPPYSAWRTDGTGRPAALVAAMSRGSMVAMAKKPLTRSAPMISTQAGASKSVTMATGRPRAR